MERKTVISLSEEEVKEFEKELEMCITINVFDTGYVELEYADYEKEREALETGKTYEQLDQELHAKLICAVNKKYNTNIPDNATLFCAVGVDFYIGFIY